MDFLPIPVLSTKVTPRRWKGFGRVVEILRMQGDNFKGNERFEVQGHLGSGTSGDVYRAWDRRLETHIALKTLHKTDPAAIYRFKREFRALADVQHPNLVQLYELLSEDGRWFFTMELVEGLDFLDFARTEPATEPFETGRFYSLPTPSAPSDPDRLRQALRQLARGLAALHGAGKLHCDIKPPNIRVTPEGRLVLLDFGLVKDVYNPSQIYQTIDSDVAGTPAYMSPEQAAGRQVTPASDWYSVGVLLYEALTGRLPFQGGFLKILMDKQRSDPVAPKLLIPHVPEDLDELCRLLLSREAKRRPDAVRVLRALGVNSEQPLAQVGTHSSSGALSAPFVGREAQLAALWSAFEKTRAGRSAVIFVHGSSGMGKSALVRRFFLQLRERHEETVLLTGRCYERESVPYKALDSLVDSLSRYLRQLPEQECEVLMPTNVLALARLFPALRRVPSVAGAQRRVLEIPDSREQRRRAFTALRELLARLAERLPLVLFIDDLQWGDLDSSALLGELLRPPDAPPLLLLACYRSEERDTSPLLKALLTKELGATDVNELHLRELPADEARRLVLDLLGEDNPGTRALASTIAAESGGSPFFIDELVRYSKAVAGLDQRGAKTLSGEVERALARRMTLESLIHARLESLSPEARRLLRIAAVAGRPVDLEAARQAADLREEAQAAIALLRGASLLRLRGTPDGEEVETYHDRIREAVINRMDEGAHSVAHRRLARALEATGRADPEILARHYLEAGDRERAAELAEMAAVQAAEALAFERAARLFQMALGLGHHEDEAKRQLKVLLGDALTNAGRSSEAAEAYLEAAQGGTAAEALELRRRAAEQLLISGRVDAGLSVVQQVLGSVGMRLPKTPRAALAALLRQMLRLKIRGLSFKERDASQVAAEQLLKIDTCWSVSVGLGTVDTIRGQSFAKQHLLLALRAGEPYRVARALAIEAGYSGTAGNKGAARTAELVHNARELAQKVGHPHALGLSDLTAGVAAYLEGRWRDALDLIERGEATLRERCTGVTWELDTAIAYQLRALFFLGRLRDMLNLLPGYLADAQNRSDLFGETNLRCRFTCLAMLCADRPKEAEAEADEAIERWSQDGFHIQHYWHLLSRVEVALYRGDGQGAWKALAAAWPKLTDSLLTRIQFTRTESLHMRCRCALGAASALGPEHPQTAQLLDLLREDVTRIESEGLLWAKPLAQLVRSGMATLVGDREAAAQLAKDAAEGLSKADMNLYAAAARRRQGELEGGSGRTLIAATDRWMHEEGIWQPDLWMRVLAPGLWG